MSTIEYWGLKDIATRLSLNRPGTALEWYRRYSLPIMLRRRGSHPSLRCGTHMKACCRSGSWPLSSGNGKNYLLNRNDKSGAELNQAGSERNCTGIGA